MCVQDLWNLNRGQLLSKVIDKAGEEGFMGTSQDPLSCTLLLAHMPPREGRILHNPPRMYTQVVNPMLF